MLARPLEHATGNEPVAVEIHVCGDSGPSGVEKVVDGGAGDGRLKRCDDVGATADCAPDLRTDDVSVVAR